MVDGRVEQSPIVLHPYQVELSETIRGLLRRGIKRILLQSPTGSGKTVIAAYMLEGAMRRGKRAFFLNHRRELIKQSAKAFWKANIPAGIIASGFYPDPKLQIQVASVQTLVRRYKTIEPPDLVIYDETHHLAAKTWTEIYKAYPDAVHIGLSATPQRTDGAGLGAFFDELVLGPSVSELIEGKYLAPYRLFGPKHPDLTDVHTIGGDYDKKELADVMKTSTVVGDAVAEYLQHGQGLTGIAFTWSVESSKELAQRFTDAGVPAAHIDGTTDDRMRDGAIQAYREGKIKILTNVDIVGEGFDLPAASMGFFLRPTKSLAIYLQQVGRVLRFAEGKTALLYDHSGNYERFGYPDDDREWSLQGRDKKKKKKDPSQATKICPGCFLVCKRVAPTCSNCGHVFVITPRDVEVEEGQLTEIDVKRVQKAKRMEQGSAQTIEDLTKIGYARKMKNPHAWARIVFNARQKKEQAKQQKKEQNSGDPNPWLSF